MATLSACLVQVKERKAYLAKLETTDMGKPIQEAEWDMVSVLPWWHGGPSMSSRTLQMQIHILSLVT